MGSCADLIKAIDAYIAKADDNLKDVLDEAGFVNPDETVKKISSLEDKIYAILTAETLYIKDKIKSVSDLTALYYNGEWDEIKRDDPTAEELEELFQDEFTEYIPELADNYMRQMDSELNVDSITERTGSWINTWSIMLGLIMLISSHEKTEKLITDNLTNDISVPEFIDILTENNDDAVRARKTSVTEILRAHSVAQQEAIIQNPAVQYKEWVHTGIYQAKPRMNHIDMDGMTALKGEPFTLAGADGGIYRPMYPRDICLPPGESMNCHCTHKAVMNTDIAALPLEERQRLKYEAIGADNAAWNGDTAEMERSIDEISGLLKKAGREQANLEFLLTSPDKNGIIYVGGDKLINGKKAGGLRRSPLNTLSGADVEHLKNEIRVINADENVFVFNKGQFTGYIGEIDMIYVRGNVFPSNDGSIHPRDLMSERAVLAHEYYGHRAYRETKLQDGSWNDEFRASYMAAKNTPNLTDEDRQYLILDAVERAKEAGVTITYNEFMRRILYGKE